MAQSDFLSKLAVEQLKNKTTEEISKQQKQTLNIFKNICQNYIKQIDRLVNQASDNLTLENRIKRMGQLMHPKNNKLIIVQDLLIKTLQFEKSFNEYLGRQIPITWVSTTTGEVKIASYEDEVELFKNAKYGVTKKGSTRSYRGLIEGVNLNTFSSILSKQLQDLQDNLNKQTKNRAEVYIQSLRRYDKTSKYQKQDDPEALQLAKQSIGKQTQYWRKTIRGDKIWWKKIRSRGFLGEGYITLILEHPYSGPQIHFDPAQMPDYVLEAQEQIGLLAEYASQGDSVPGAIQGDVKVKDGHIQLAVKQGPSFHTASITIDVAIAYAFLTNQQSQLLLPENINKSLEKLVKECQNDTTSWEKVYEWLAGIPIQRVRGEQLKTIIKIL